jgi:hypothetical protein
LEEEREKNVANPCDGEKLGVEMGTKKKGEWREDVLWQMRTGGRRRRKRIREVNGEGERGSREVL